MWRGSLLYLCPPHTSLSISGHSSISTCPHTQETTVTACQQTDHSPGPPILLPTLKACQQAHTTWCPGPGLLTAWSPYHHPAAHPWSLLRYACVIVSWFLKWVLPRFTIPLCQTANCPHRHRRGCRPLEQTVELPASCPWIILWMVKQNFKIIASFLMEFYTHKQIKYKKGNFVNWISFLLKSRKWYDRNWNSMLSDLKENIEAAKLQFSLNFLPSRTPINQVLTYKCLFPYKTSEIRKIASSTSSCWSTISKIVFFFTLLIYSLIWPIKALVWYSSLNNEHCSM